jgi:hypothetical protein
MVRRLMKPKRPKQNNLRSRKPGSPIVKPVSVKPSDRPTRMGAVNSAKTIGTNPIPGIPQIPAILPKKTSGVKPVATRRPKLGLH